MTWEKYVLKISDQVTITIDYENTTHLPMMHDYKSIYSTDKFLAMTGCVTSDKNNNINHLENLILQWRFKLGHTSFYTVK